MPLSDQFREKQLKEDELAGRLNQLPVLFLLRQAQVLEVVMCQIWMLAHLPQLPPKSQHHFLKVCVRGRPACIMMFRIAVTFGGAMVGRPCGLRPCLPRKPQKSRTRPPGRLNRMSGTALDPLMRREGDGDSAATITTTN